MSTEEQLRWEASRRGRAAAAALAAGVLTLAGGIASAVVYKDFPSSSPGDASLRVLFYHQHKGALWLVAIVLALGALALIPALDYLYHATKARRPQTPPVARIMAFAGPVAVAVGQIVQQVVITRDADAFAKLSHPQIRVSHAHDILQSDWIIAAAVIRQAAVIALGFAFVLISLNAMRTGLLTRFMGILGIIVGVLFVIPIGSPLPIVQSFWLIAVGVLFLGRWPNGVPPAWASGQAEPWPSQQEVRERRDRARGEAAPPERRPQPAPAAAVAPPEGAPAPVPAHPGSKKRKRKKRR